MPLWSFPLVGLVSATVLFVNALRAIAQGTQDFAGYGASNAIEGVAKVCGIVAMIAIGLKLGGGLVGFLIGTLFALVFLGSRLWRRYASSRPHAVRYDWRRILNAGAGAAAATTAIALMGSADVVLVKHYFPEHAAGLYAAASLGGKMLLYLVGFVPTVLLPQAADRHARGARTRDVLGGSLAMLAVVALCGIAIFHFFGLFVLHALVGHAFDAAAPLLVRYGVAMVLLAFTNALTFYGIATHRLAFTVPLLVCTLGTLSAIVLMHPTLERVVGIMVIGNLAAAYCRHDCAHLAARHERTAIDRLKRVLLIGGSGQLGTAIAQTWNDCVVVAPPHDALQLEDSAAVERALIEADAGTIVNAAAFADVDRCERESDRAMQINAYAVGRAAQIAARNDANLLTLSTDYVFDGRKGAPYTESDEPHPLSAYGRSKLEGELLVEASGARAFVVRTCGVYGPSRSARGRRGFIDRVLDGGERRPMRVVSDVVVSPTFAGDLARALRRLLESQRYGLYHAVNEGAGQLVRFRPRSCQSGREPARWCSRSPGRTGRRPRCVRPTRRSRTAACAKSALRCPRGARASPPI